MTISAETVLFHIDNEFQELANRRNRGIAGLRLRLFTHITQDVHDLSCPTA